MYVLLTVRAIFCKPEGGPAVPATGVCAAALGETTLGDHGAGDGDAAAAAPAAGAVMALKS